MGQAYTIAELRSRSIDDLIREHDEQVPRTQVGINYYRDEILRREVEAHQNQIEQMTATIRRLTWWITGLTVVNTAAGHLVGIPLNPGGRSNIRSSSDATKGVLPAERQEFARPGAGVGRDGPEAVQPVLGVVREETRHLVRGKRLTGPAHGGP